jgi:hypothetical protein
MNNSMLHNAVYSLEVSPWNQRLYILEDKLRHDFILDSFNIPCSAYNF